ncbi:Nn.00g046810.m01.CDS01 [Neocucurbitaria sp. VM-36]
MGVPFEALLPYAIMTGVRFLDPLAALEGVNVMLQFFAFSAVSVGKLREMQNGGKRGRRGVDAWDRYNSSAMTSYPYTHETAVMERDRRLTGFARGQTDKAAAPAGFELNNPWRCEQRFL